ncbi:hypothetical protein SNK04_009318 [Fusarium graminearum]
MQSSALAHMFQWYRNAEVCYVYLVDVEKDVDTEEQEQQFRASRWFTRGWTLQELIAPRQVIFFNKGWEEIGTKSTLIDIITEITKIPKTVLLMNHPGEMSIAQCMSWAADRKTSRVEDRAYSLMGLLGISIPMLYGEGDRAFERLQLEIIKGSDDQSIFAWTGDAERPPGGPLARSPDDFKNSHDIRHVIDTDNAPVPYGVTNKGLRMTVPLASHGPGEKLHWAALNCRRGNNGTLLCILLERDGSHHTYTRVQYDKLQPVDDDERFTMTEIYVKETVNRTFEISNWIRTEPNYLFVVRNLKASNKRMKNGCEQVSWSNKHKDILLEFRQSGHSVVLAFQNGDKPRRFEICVGLHNYTAWCWMLEDPEPRFENFEKDDEIRNVRWKNTDRQALHIDGAEKASVAVTRGCISRMT